MSHDDRRYAAAYRAMLELGRWRHGRPLDDMVFSDSRGNPA